MDSMPGRKTIINYLVSLMLGRQAIMLYGPVGIGKTTILENVKQAIERLHRPWGFAEKTGSLSDITQALLMAYPGSSDKDTSQRQIRSALRAEIEDNPGVLFLDHIHNPGTQFKGFLHSLIYAGMGILISADAEGPLNHALLRAMHIAWREIAVRPLPNRYMYRILENLLSGKVLPNPLKNSDCSALIKMAHGRPGWMLMISELLQKPEYWCNGNVLLSKIRINVRIDIAAIYFESID
jgi:replication-associated recombination protein RarA